MTPKVTVFTPIHNGQRTIARTIKSVLAQSFRDFEYIIVNDASTDDSENIILQFAATDPRIIYAKNDNNKGLNKTRQIGLELSKGEFLAPIDDDDEWTDKDKLKKQVAYLEENKSIVALGTASTMVDTHGEIIKIYDRPLQNKQIRKIILLENPILNVSALLRIDAIKNVGGYDTTDIGTAGAEDYGLILKLGKVGELANLPDNTVRWEARPLSTTSKNKLKQCQNIFKLIQERHHGYPNYLPAMIKGIARIIIYGYLQGFNARYFPSKYLKGKRTTA